MSFFSVRSLRGLFQALDRLVRGVPPPPTPEDTHRALADLRNATPEQLEEARRVARRVIGATSRPRHESTRLLEPPPTNDDQK
jgi:hypothetical protein